MTAPSTTSGVFDGRLLLLVHDGPDFDIDRFRTRRHPSLVVVHARPDGSHDPCVPPPFARAVVTGPTSDPQRLRRVTDYAAARLVDGGVIEFVDPTGGAEAALPVIRAALPDMDVTVATLPAPVKLTVVEVRGAVSPTGRGRMATRFSRRRTARPGS